MGSPLGPTLANIFLCHYETLWLDQCPIQFKPTIYKLYIDDTFTCFSDQSHFELFLDYLNSKHPNIKFTIEHSINNSLPFLDIRIDHDSSFSHSVYRKPTFTGLGTNFHSFSFSQFKINAIKALIHRAFHLSSSYVHFNLEIEFLKQFFINNCYPVHLFEKILRNFLNSLHQSKKLVSTAKKKTMYIPLPYLGTPSESDYKSFFQSLSLCYPHINFCPVLKSGSTIGSFFSYKDRLPATLRSCAIYKFSCSGCNATYIGSTKRRTFERFCEHLGLSNRTKKPLTSPPFSYIRNHSIDCNHPISLNNFKTLSYAPQHSLAIAESISILKYQPSLNYQSIATPLYITDKPGGSCDS